MRRESTDWIYLDQDRNCWWNYCELYSESSGSIKDGNFFTIYVTGSFSALCSVELVVAAWREIYYELDLRQCYDILVYVVRYLL
jgi:hypothetical protein